MFLDATTKSLELVLGGAITTNQLPIVVDYVDMTTTTTLAGEQDSISNSATLVTILSAPAASTQRKVNGITVYNADTVAATVTIRLNNNATLRPLVVTTLQVGDTLGYTDVRGWYVQDINGNNKISNISPLYLPLTGGTLSGALSATSLSASGTVSGTGFSNYMTAGLASGQPGAFSTLSASNIGGLATLKLGSHATVNGWTADSNWGMMFAPQQIGAIGNFLFENYAGGVAAYITDGGLINATSFTGAGTGLTGTAAGLSIGGNAATATNAGYATNAGVVGTWTPTITAGSGTFTTVSASGSYIKIGNHVTVQVTVSITTNGTAATSVILSLPFTSNGSFVGVTRENAVTGALGQIYTSLSSTAVMVTNTNSYPGGNGYQLNGTLTYFTA